MRKWMLLALVATLSLVVAVPAVAQTVSLAQCATVTRNGQAVTEYSGVVDGVEVSGRVVQPNGTVSVNCKQLIPDAAAAQVEAQPPAPPVSAEAKAGKAEATAKTGKAEAKAGKTEAKAEAKAELPKTGGGDTLFALGVGGLLVDGGILVRTLAR